MCALQIFCIIIIFITFDRTGNYEISEAQGVQKGTKIVIHLKKDCWRFAMEADVKGQS